MNDQAPQTESEFVFRRLTETFKVFGTEQDGQWWLLILGVALVVGIAFVIWMYIKDARTVPWYWAAPLAATRILVYLILGVLFLMPARQGYEKVEKHSRVLVVVDVSDSSSQLSDDPVTAGGKPVTRLARIMNYLSDDKIGFVKGLLDKNPIYVYRFGNRLDEESQLLEKGVDGATPIHRVPGRMARRRVEGPTWQTPDWQAFATYDFKPWLLRGLTDEGPA